MTRVEYTQEQHEAFKAVREIVERLYGEGRSVRSASVKPLLSVTLPTGFSEESLGYSSYREFLSAAEAAGYIVLRPASRGPDVDVVPPGQETAATETPPSRWLRRDLYKAFVDWTPTYARLYDKREDIALMLPKAPSDSESGWVTQTRDHWQTEPDRFVEIEPISRETTIEWMEAFAEGLDDNGQKSALQAALGAQRPLQTFVAIVESQGLGQPWHTVRMSEVEKTIVGWAAENDLDIDLKAERGHGPTFRKDLRPGPLILDDSIDALRARVRAAVDQMSRTDLLRLPIPLEYLID